MSVLAAYMRPGSKSKIVKVVPYFLVSYMHYSIARQSQLYVHRSLFFSCLECEYKRRKKKLRLVDPLFSSI